MGLVVLKNLKNPEIAEIVEVSGQDVG